jgi:hypothetical protein
MLRVAVIGAGWTGCHIAKSLIDKSVQVEIFEKSNSIFAGASGNNQCRLHLGFHNPRASLTVREEISAYDAFCRTYARFAQDFSKNIYAIADKETLIDFETYCLIMRNHGVAFEVVDAAENGITQVEGCLLIQEKVLNLEKAADYFKSILAPNLRLGQEVQSLTTHSDFVKVNGEKFDLALNCTYNQFSPFDVGRFTYEACLMSLYRLKPGAQARALTVMDGNFGSIYPYPTLSGDWLFSASAVEATPFFKTDKIENAINAISKLSATEINKIKNHIEEVMHGFCPSFPGDYEFLRPIVSIKTKEVGERNGKRESHVIGNGRLLHIFAAKLNSVLMLEQEILESIQKITDTDIKI